jgi:ankyrin repeat protein
MVLDRFRWVSCQLDTLRRCIPSSIPKVLKELPTTLDDTYEKALEGIPKEKRKLAYRLFQCLVAAFRPLNVGELAEIFIIKFDSDESPSLTEDWRPENPEDELLSACSTLISIIEVEGSKIVQFSHFTVKEFLTADRIREAEVADIRRYYIPTNAAHAVLAQVCLTVLLQLDEKVNKNQLVSFPLVSYAAQYWADHARIEGVEPQVKDIMMRLFDPKKPHLRAWIWINDLDSDAKRSMDSIDEKPSPVDATPLYYASLCGLSWMARHLITTRHDDVNAKCGRHGSPLHAASHKGHVDVARVLLDYRAGVNVTNRYRKSPLAMAYDAKHDGVIELLLQRGANVESLFDYRGRLIHRASSDGRTDVVRMALRNGADVNVKGDMLWTPLHFAASHGNLEVVNLLVERKANVNIQVRDHGTPMHLAARRGHTEIVRVLLQNGADVHARGDDGRTALEIATAYEHSEIEQLLLKAGAKGE